jgi:N-acetylglucosaminyldiphosphoundecaprenol N-acetyl-beta-D-mannosaminyltransferase
MTHTQEAKSGEIRPGGRLLGVPLSGYSLVELKDAALSRVVDREGTFIFACANPHSLVVAHRDSQFRVALERASAVVADGVGCKWGAVLSGTKIGPRITGMDFFLSTMQALNEQGLKAFFLGSSKEVLSKLTDKVRLEFPRVAINSLSPPFRPWSADEDRQMIKAIRDFAPDVLWVGMTAPKQEKWVAAHADELGVPVVGSIGAVFDYYAGTTQRAPAWICSLGLEWLYRLPREPKRLWRRTFVSAPLFLWYVCQQRLER